MKKLHVLCLATGIVGMAATAFAYTPSVYDYTIGNGIAETPHNMNLTPYISLAGSGSMDNQDLGRICIYCHTPHFAKKADANLTYTPLWNRETPVLSYTMYNNGDNPQEIGDWKQTSDGATSGLANHNSYAAAMGIWDGTIGDDIVEPGSANQPGGGSLMCLSCHDGTIALNTYGTAPSSSVGAGDVTIDGGTQYSIGTAQDLSNHHPIGFSYLEAYNRDDELKDPSSAIGVMTIAELLAGNGNMECNTCHDVHNTKNTGDKFVWQDNTGSAFCLACHDK